MGRFRERKIFNLAPIGVGIEYGVHNADLDTALRAVVTRVFYHKDGNGGWERPFRPSHDEFFKMHRVARRALLRHTKVLTPLTPEQYIGAYVGRKRRMYERAAASLAINPLTVKDSYVTAFVKAEKLCLKSKDGKWYLDADKDPRLIQPRGPRYNLRLGVYIKACEHVIYKAIDEMWGGPTVMKGKNADKRGQAIADLWKRYKNPVAIGLDAERLDQHEAQAALEFEHSLYYALFGYDHNLAWLLHMQLVTIGFIRCHDGYIKYVVHGGRCSGDVNTSLGNIALVTLILWSYCQSIHLTCSLVNDGDDCVLIMEFADLNNFLNGVKNWFERSGFRIKLEQPVRTLEHIEFCQSHPVEITPGVYRMVRDPRVVLNKDLVVVKPIQNKQDYDFYRRAIGECGMSLAGDVPVFCQFYQALIRGTVPSTRKVELESGMQYLALGMSAKFQEPTSVCRISFWEAFGITPDYQVALEKDYARMSLTWHPPTHTFRFGNLIAGM